jgi:hypothetical protein
MTLKDLMLSVGENRQVKTSIQRISVKDLKFYVKNPRISSILSTCKASPSDDQIYSMMWENKGEGTRILYQRIKKDGNVNEPVLVYKNYTIEGNTRLAVVRKLYGESKGQEKQNWGMVPCRVIEETLSDKEIDQILSDVHIKKKRDWDPYELACWLSEMKEEGRTLSEIHEITGMAPNKISDYITAFREMQKKDEQDPKKFSVYYETLRQPVVKDAIKSGLPIMDVVSNKYKKGELNGAIDFRNLSRILKSKKATKYLIEKDVTLERATEIAVMENPEEGDPLLKRISELTEDLKDIEHTKVREIKNDSIRRKIFLDLKKQVDEICESF